MILKGQEGSLTIRLRKTTTCSSTLHLWLKTLRKWWNLWRRTTGLRNAEYTIYCLYAPISCYNCCVENRLWKSCYLKFWVYSKLRLITMIIIVRNSPFCSQTVPCNFRQLMTCHWVYFLTYLYFNPRSVTNIQRMVSVSEYIIDYKKRGHQYIAKKVG